MSGADRKPGCRDAGCGCPASAPGGVGASRRALLKGMGAGAAGWILSPGGVMAGPFDRSEFEKLIPPDKKLAPEWVKSLYARGKSEVYGGPGRKSELARIGMPVGGICAGQVYLGGDGRLWRWNVMNAYRKTSDGTYMEPPEPDYPFEQGFAIRVRRGDTVLVRALDHRGFDTITFCGEYPVGQVGYRDDSLPVAVDLEAFSPFIPLDADDSGLPVIVMNYTVRNTGSRPVTVDVAGWLENAVCIHTKPACTLHNRIVRRGNALCLDARALAPAETDEPDIVFEDFEDGDLDGWTVAGEAFGNNPVTVETARHQGKGAEPQGRFFVHSSQLNGRDKTTGTLTSKPFKIERDYIVFLICGAKDNKTCLNLMIDGKVVKSQPGIADKYKAGAPLEVRGYDVRELKGRTARLQLQDLATGAYGRGVIGLDYVVFTNTPKNSWKPFTESHDYGTMTMALLDSVGADGAVTGLPEGRRPDVLFSSKGLADAGVESTQMGKGELTGAVCRKLTLEPGGEETVSFAIAWNFPNLEITNGGPGHGRIRLIDNGRYYTNTFPGSGATVEYLAKHFKRLCERTRLWHDTWYDSSLPYWFLNRTFANLSTLASNTCHRFKSGRFWGWEGVDCCPGTCTHVWHYAHAVGRVFPELERTCREEADYGVAFNDETGLICYRGEKERERGLRGMSGDGSAVDGQAGSLLRTYREHQMSGSREFLKRVWPRVKKAIGWMIHEDRDSNGLLEGKQHNTLDCEFYGPGAWLSGLYVAALRAGEAMALELGEHAYAAELRALADRGSRNIEALLYDGEYFIHKPQKEHAGATNSTTGCHIDQVFGQSWMHQVALGRMLPEDKTVSALKALYKYNFAVDAGLYKKKHSGGRTFAAGGEAGLYICTWPKGEGEIKHVNRSPVDLFSECMHGFEYQAAGHMIFEGLVQEGLAVTRSIHDRYHPSKRNPWNEIECGEHYARSMASYGVFLAACGFEYHGPKGHIGFAPRLTPEHFKAAFVGAEGWGTFEQEVEESAVRGQIAVKVGTLRVKTVALGLDKDRKPTAVKAALNGKPVGAHLKVADGKALITLEADAVIRAGESLDVSL